MGFRPLITFGKILAKINPLLVGNALIDVQIILTANALP